MTGMAKKFSFHILVLGRITAPVIFPILRPSILSTFPLFTWIRPTAHGLLKITKWRTCHHQKLFQHLVEEHPDWSSWWSNKLQFFQYEYTQLVKSTFLTQNCYWVQSTCSEVMGVLGISLEMSLKQVYFTSNIYETASHPLGSSRAVSKNEALLLSVLSQLHSAKNGQAFNINK